RSYVSNIADSCDIYLVIDAHQSDSRMNENSCSDRSGWVSPRNRATPTVPSVSLSGTGSYAVFSKPDSASQRRILTGMSGFGRWRVQITVASGAANIGSARSVFSISVSLMLLKTQHTSTRSAGTAPAYMVVS